MLVSAPFAEGLQPLTARYPDLELVSFQLSEQALREIGDAVAVVGLFSSHPGGRIRESRQETQVDGIR